MPLDTHISEPFNFGCLVGGNGYKLCDDGVINGTDGKYVR